jgi:POT family proton-dependent oligopeptide transporter
MPKDPTSELAPGAGAPPAAASLAGPQVFGHPIGLFTLFFTELWERFSYYGMRGILILFMAAPLARNGLGFSDGKSAAIYGLYTSFVYLLALPGGWVADKLWGQRRAVFVGGCVIAAGHFTMAMPMFGLPEQPLFYLGLVLIVFGTGLLKPNVSTIVGELYPEGGARRDAGFSIFYMGINIGAFAGPLVCGYLGEKVNWHWGFSAAGFGMVLGLISYKIGDRWLGRAGYLQGDDSAAVLSRRYRGFYLTLGVVGVTALLFVWLAVSGTLPVTLEAVALWIGYGIILLTILYFTYLILSWRWALGILALFGVLLAVFLAIAADPDIAGRWATVAALGAFIVLNLTQLAVARGGVSLEKRRLMVIFWLFLLAATFWAGFEQAGSSMNLFTERLTDREVFGRQMPASWLQSINPIFIILLAPVFGWVWISLARRQSNPSIPVKFALGLFGLSAGFFVLAWGSANASAQNLVSPAWLVVTYFLHTCGELCLSPVGLSSITKLAPAGRVGQMMGVWFIGSAVGNLFAGLVAGALENLDPAALFWRVAVFVGVAAAVAMLLAPLVRRLMGPVE